ncbi:MAG: glycoside hydrolase family 36 protein [Christensenellales bacterium]
MLENYYLHIRYKDGREIKTATGNNDDFTLTYTKNNACLTLDIKVNVPVEIDKVWLEMEYDFAPGDKFFANGYQSWTDSKEFTADMKMADEGLICKTLIGKKLGLRKYGDYDWVEQPRRKGQFHSHGYAYVRRGDEIDFVGSLSDKEGYTIISADMKENRIRIFKDLEGVTIDNTYTLFRLISLKGEYNEVFDKYFAMMGIPRPLYPVIKGYTTWYNYYQNINESIVLNDLNNIAATGLINTFQIDDGYQTKVGEWLSIDPAKFPNGLGPTVQNIHSKGLQAGLWLAPFAVQKTSSMITEHPDWFVTDKDGNLFYCGANWGGFYALDIYNKEVRAYIKKCFAYFKDLGFDLFKLDFLYCAAIIPRNNKSRATIMYDAISFLRECVGDRKILACGTPLMPCFGRVEYMRIGADMGLRWKKTLSQRLSHREDVSSQEAVNNILYRRHLNKRAFMCDPDVFTLRDYNTGFTQSQQMLLSTIIKIFGSVLFTSDDTGRYNGEQKAQFARVMQESEMWVEDVDQQKNVVTIRYSQDGDEKVLKFDAKTCTQLS